MSVLIEITGDYTESFIDTHQPEGSAVELALASGLGGERILKIFSEVTKPALAKVSEIVGNALQPDLVKGIKISRDGVEIGSMRLKDADKVKAFTLDVLSRLE